jgi:hypothetical protein
MDHAIRPILVTATVSEATLAVRAAVTDLDTVHVLTLLTVEEWPHERALTYVASARQLLWRPVAVFPEFDLLVEGDDEATRRFMATMPPEAFRRLT